MNSDDISIVLAVYNGEKYISKLLDSVLAQTAVTISELIIIDDTSSDHSVEIIKTYQQKYPVINLIRNEVNLGPIASFIKGAKLSSSNYIAFADQDDIWQADKLSLSLNLLKKIDVDDKPAAIFTDLAMIDEQDKPLHPSFWGLYHIKPADNTFFTVLFANIATGCTMLINKNMLNEFISMPLNAQMHDHWIALIAFSFGNWGYLDEKTILYRVHSNSVTSKDEVTFGKKAKNFLAATFSKNPVFLSDYIDQAALFRSKYKNRLNEQQNRQLDYFTGLKNSSGFIKKINSKFRFALKKRMF